jgi:signal transduction histidine kinase
MEPNQLHELATNAELNHWPPHLGVVSESDKIQYLADRLREAAERTDDLESQMLTFEEIETGRDTQVELAIKAPDAVPETEQEASLREQSKERHFAVNMDDTESAFDAGWKAAKAYYENRI